MTVFALANQKGGVGKTTTTVNLGTALAACDNSVLLIDFDPQANASTGLGIDIKKHARQNVYHGLLDHNIPADQIIIQTPVPGLHIMPASQELAAAEVELVTPKDREFKLKRLVDECREQYDFILIDCPPALGLLTVNALCCADRVIIPLQTEYYALEGLAYLLKTVTRVQKTFNKNLELFGVLLTMFDGRNNLAKNVRDDVAKHLGAKVFDTIIPRNVKISESPSHGKPVILYDVKSAGARAYMQLAAEVLKRAG